MAATWIGKTLFQSAPHLSPQDFRDALRAAPLLQGAADVHLKQLLSQCPKRLYRRGEVIYEQGRFGHSLFILVGGEVHLGARERGGEGAWQVRRALRAPGEVFGEEVVLGAAPRALTAVAEGEAVAVVEVELARLTRLDRLLDGRLLERLALSRSRDALLDLLRGHPALMALSERARLALAEGAQLRLMARGARLELSPQLVGSAVPAGCSHLLVRAGVFKLTAAPSPAGGAAGRVLAYLNEGDVVHLAPLLSAGGGAGVLLEAAERGEVLYLEAGAVRGLSAADRQLLEALEFTPRPLQGAAGAPNTVFQFVESLLSEGAQEGMSLLTINLDHCVRCGQCVRACEDRHGHARMTRRGKALVRRRDVAVAGEHQKVLIPTSCRHCANPECMIGCPTGAIHRAPSGEVDIKDSCIGCASCANRCPYGNITMVPTPEREVHGVVRDLIASKCNLCSGYEEPNCVHNCPTGAILRVEPTAYFEELAEALGEPLRRAAGEAGKTATARRGGRGAWALWLGTLAAAAAALAASAWAPPSPWGGPRLWLGVGAALAMAAALALAGRRRAAGRRAQGGALRVWTQVHLAAGALALALMVAHTGGRAGAGLTAALWALTWGEVLLGAAGWWLYRVTPRLLSELEGGAQVEEDAAAEARASAAARAALEAAAPPEQVARLALWLPGPLALLSPRYRAGAARERLRGLLAAHPLPEDLRGALQGWAEQALRGRELEAVARLYALRRRWLVCHLAAAAAVLVLMIAHIAAVGAALLG
ncbi:MAG: 4Fe-4S dicluster domain-containing protein [Deltaproteobacteria bacterium]|nr:4Fe-4S dicluster domain-containing protein [Deltaproteobacteria bacterium]